MHVRTLRSLIVAAGAAVALVGCGSDGTDDAAGSDGEPPAASGCETKVSATYPSGTTVDLDTAEAVSLADGGAFTIYVGDYEIPTDEIATATIEPPDGSHQATIYLTPLGSLSDAAPIEEGAQVRYSTESGVLTFSAILLDQDGMANQALDATGELTVDELSSDELCLTVDYADAEKKISGTVGATIHASPF